MKKTYYELCTFPIEVNKLDRRYTTPEEVYQHYDNTTPDTVTRFDTPEDARAEYERRGYNTPDKMADKGSYWFGYLTYIEENTYEIDEDGDEEWIDGGNWIECNFPIIE